MLLLERTDRCAAAWRWARLLVKNSRRAFSRALSNMPRFSGGTRFTAIAATLGAVERICHGRQACAGSGSGSTCLPLLFRFSTVLSLCSVADLRRYDCSPPFNGWRQRAGKRLRGGMAKPTLQQHTGASLLRHRFWHLPFSLPKLTGRPSVLLASLLSA